MIPTPFEIPTFIHSVVASSYPLKELDHYDEVLKRDKRHAQRHDEIGVGQRHVPRGAGGPARLGGLPPQKIGDHGHDRDEHEAQNCRDELDVELRLGRQPVDDQGEVHVIAVPQPVCAAHEGGEHQEVGGELQLPHGRGAEHVPEKDAVADYQHRDQDQHGARVARELREPIYVPEQQGRPWVSRFVHANTPSPMPRGAGATLAPALLPTLLVRHLAGELDQLLATLHVTGEVVPDRLGGLLPLREGLVVHRRDVHARLLELLVDADVVLLRGGIGVLLQLRAHLFEDLLLFGRQLFELLRAYYQGLEHEPERVPTRGRGVRLDLLVEPVRAERRGRRYRAVQGPGLHGVVDLRGVHAREPETDSLEHLLHPRTRGAGHHAGSDIVGSDYGISFLHPDRSRVPDPSEDLDPVLLRHLLDPAPDLRVLPVLRLGVVAHHRRHQGDAERRHVARGVVERVDRHIRGPLLHGLELLIGILYHGVIGVDLDGNVSVCSLLYLLREPLRQYGTEVTLALARGGPLVREAQRYRTVASPALREPAGAQQTDHQGRSYTAQE